MLYNHLLEFSEKVDLSSYSRIFNDSMREQTSVVGPMVGIGISFITTFSFSEI